MQAWAREHKRALTIAAAGLYGSTFALLLWEQNVGALPGEAQLANRYFYKPGTPRAAQAVDFFANMGTPIVVVVTILVVMLITNREFGAGIAVLLPLAVVPAFIARIIKTSTGPTDLALAARQLPLDATGSLPSGHTAYVTALFGFVAVMGHVRHRRDVVVAAGVPIVAIGPSLVVRGAHYPSDVLAGYTLGLAWVATMLLLLCAGGRGGTPARRYAPRRARRTTK